MVKRRYGSEDDGTSPLVGTFHHGRDEAAAWLRSLGLKGLGRWHVEATLASGATRFHLYVYAEEWGFAFHHGRQSSWIRVTDIPFVHGRDDFKLIRELGALSDLRDVIERLELEHELAFARATAVVRTNITGAAAAVRRWLQAGRRR
jgi:hypothetical protein